MRSYGTAGESMTSNSGCSVAGCDRAVRCKGLCSRHYQRQRVHGDPLAGGPELLRWPENLLTRLEPQPNGCILWGGKPNPDGYSQIAKNGRLHMTHRAAYELWVGPIPEGMTIDHECHNRDETCKGGDTCPHRRCVNPEHLVPKSMRANTEASPHTNAGKATCVRGHQVVKEQVGYCAECVSMLQTGRSCSGCGDPLTRQHWMVFSPPSVGCREYRLCAGCMEGMVFRSTDGERS